MNYTPVLVLDDIHHINHDHSDVTFPSLACALSGLASIKEDEKMRGWDALIALHGRL